MLSRIKIGTKIYVIVALLSIVAAGISAVAFTGLKALSHSTDRLDIASTEVRLASRLNQMVLELNRAELQVAANPASLDNARAVVASVIEQAETDLQMLRETADAQQVSMLEDLEEDYRTYLAAVHQTFTEAEEHRNAELSAGQQVLLSRVTENRNLVSELREALFGLASYTDDKSTTISSEASALADNRISTLLAIALVGVLSGVVAGFSIGRFGIATPLRRIMQVIKALSEDKLDVEVVFEERGDEIGELARTAGYFKQKLNRNAELEAEAEASEARAAERRAKEMNALAEEFETTVGEVIAQVSAAAEQLLGNSTSLAAASEQSNQQAMTVSAAAEQASSNVQSVAGAAEEFSATIAEVNQQISRSTKQSQEASDRAATSTAAMDELRHTVNSVASVTELISDIAEKTNLLALNATIEAARAGEAGKGFAVVATEVKDLAEQTGRATGDIAGQVEQMQEVADRSISAVQAIAELIDGIRENSESIAAAAEEQGVTTSEISRNVAEAANGTSEVSSNIRGVTEAATEIGRSSSEVREAAGLLADQVKHLSGEVDGFIARVRAA